MSKLKILFVCVGNICRSPLAEGIAREISKRKNLALEIDSAGISSWHEGEVPCADSIKIAKMHHVDISKLRARQVKITDKDKFDHVVAMDAKNKKKLETLGFTNVYLLGEFADYLGADVPDPYFFDTFDENIENVYTMIEACVEDLIEKAENGTL
ncbi:low molecular weight protein-tyrosine-phosphatase [Sulfurovum sp.]|uniref:low molecular weight protein-tyrosine-phosphatase n=1 Tax=Sulfurovum sp. TaxID=1969726 RepID=UPI0025EAEC3C|nr:low molecular weight protein-tyrosine-phosphatase [Sulfurovum sp.]